MRTPQRTSVRSRILSIAASVALAAGVTVAGATAAQAAPDDSYTISGVVTTSTAAPLEGVLVSIVIPDPGYSSWVPTTSTDASGAYEFSGIPVGGPYDMSFELDGYAIDFTTVTVVDSDVTVPTHVLLPPTDISTATATITGTGGLGTDLTVTTTGWPADTEFSYQWFAPTSNHSGDIAGAESATYTVTADVVGRDVWVWVFGSVPGVSATSMIASSNSVAAYDVERPTGAAPADLDAYLRDNGSTPQDQTTAGLPAGPLNPGTAQNAELPWAAADSFVDVYVFSTPVRVGTFPVVGGVARITLSPAVLGQLTTGSHTLVATGQTSGAVQSLRLSIGLAATGSEPPLVPMGVAALLLLTGAGLVVARRRIASQR